MLAKFLVSYIIITATGIFLLYRDTRVHINQLQKLENTIELIKTEILHFQISSFTYVLFLTIIFYIVYRLETQKRKLSASNSILTHVQQITKTGSWEYEVASDHLYWSDEVYRIFGETPQSFQVNYETFLSFVHPEDREKITNIYTKSIEEKTNYTLRHRVVRKNGEVIWVNEIGTNTFNSEGEPVKTLGIVQDISETVLYETQIEEIKNKLENVINIQENIVIITNGKELEFANQKLFDFFGYKDLEHFLKYNSCICDFFIEDDRFFHLKKVLPHEKHWIDSLLHLSPRERIVSMVDRFDIPHAFIVAIKNYEENEYIVNFSDISDTVSENQTLQEQVVHDPLTKAYNRFYFTNKIKQIIESNQQKNLQTALIMLDIDHFKEVNDTFGHDVGDSVLVTLVNVIRRYSRYDDKLIRWGGEEFIIVISVDSIENVKRQAEHLRSVVENHHFEEVKHITCSFGCALFIDNETIDDVIKRVDDNLYKAKNSGRNRVVV
jgi:diguanylate cyclase (GGDEF)-like protein/PAS domain S-box-containing protein